MAQMIEMLRGLFPEEIPGSVTQAYVTGAAKRYMPQYELMAKEIAGVAQGALLDIGTGPGLVPLKVGKILPSVQIVGIDISEAMIAIACKKKEEAGCANVSFQVMDGKSLAFTDSSLDMIISTDALHHWKRPVVVFDEIYRCLKPGREAWIYDGFSDASDDDISNYIHGAGDIFLPHWFLRLSLFVHGYSKKEYDTSVKRMISQTRFGTCIFEKRGVMMRLRLRKAE